MDPCAAVLRMTRATQIGHLSSRATRNNSQKGDRVGPHKTGERKRDGRFYLFSANEVYKNTFIMWGEYEIYSGGST